MPIYSDTMRDQYGSEIIIRKKAGETHVQLLIRFQGEAEPFSYGFADKDFPRFANMIMQASTQLAAGVVDAN